MDYIAHKILLEEGYTETEILEMEKQQEVNEINEYYFDIEY